MMSNFQGWVGASMWTIAVLDVLLIACAIWMIYRVFAGYGAALLMDDKQSAGNRIQAAQPPTDLDKR